ncbi:MAG: hypothetical protein Ct9H300mP7_4330 [Verrucomicrobiota bacterium]|nr:MAG: hypothetical protein Ct9H300mP7_4330 [Verrucomicrobiota bacterium]
MRLSMVSALERGVFEAFVTLHGSDSVARRGRARSTSVGCTWKIFCGCSTGASITITPAAPSTCVAQPDAQPDFMQALREAFG